MFSFTFIGAALGLGLFYSILQVFLDRRRQEQLRIENRCGKIPYQSSWDPILGLDTYSNNLKRTEQKQFLRLIDEQHQLYGNTHGTRFMGMHLIRTVEPKNVQAILATQFKDFDLGPQRRAAFMPLLGTGIFNSDGANWEHSRALVRPNFARHQVSDLSPFEVHVEKLLALIIPDGKTPNDIQDLFFRLTLDSATEFLFGEAAGALDDPEDKFAEAFNFSLYMLMLRFRMGKAVGLHHNPKFLAACKTAHAFADRYVEKALKEKELEKEGGAGEERYVFLKELAKETSDPIELRDQLLNILLAGRDTTASLLSSAFFVICRRPDIWKKLKEEIATLGDSKPTFEGIKDLKYLRNVLNETLRLYPVVPTNARSANKDTMLPTGGGPSGKEPVFVPKETVIWYTTYTMHRMKEYYGEDADEFRPERWDTLRPGWEYLPFNGGPRICLGQQFALTEAAYTVIRIVQRFESIVVIPGEEDRPWIENLTLTVCPNETVRVLVK